jgi:hypothetical protein
MFLHDDVPTLCIPLPVMMLIGIELEKDYVLQAVKQTWHKSFDSILQTFWFQVRARAQILKELQHWKHRLVTPMFGNNIELGNCRHC